MSFIQQKNLGEIRQLLREAPLEESRKRELSSALHVYFKDWLYGNGCSFLFTSFVPTCLTYTSTRNTKFLYQQLFDKFAWKRSISGKFYIDVVVTQFFCQWFIGKFNLNSWPFSLVFWTFIWCKLVFLEFLFSYIWLSVINTLSNVS